MIGNMAQARNVEVTIMSTFELRIQMRSSQTSILNAYAPC